MKNIIPGYNFYHKGRESKKGGGVGIFVSDGIHGKERQYIFTYIQLKIILTNSKGPTKYFVTDSFLYSQFIK